MKDKKAAKLIIKRAKKNPYIYSQADIFYAKKELKTQVEDSYWHKYWSGLIKRLES